ncbi:hypothetical protein CCACVL1_09395 [Corchorus capsularis]|uniref:Uncharacterized protein n=1 Tax=Corchorus capsularis TaxID=210143 RepID=A0A1R3IWF0_COCAP|nr:hypothetical protein CCACVL1_09395 [Corchorus capsularis]
MARISGAAPSGISGTGFLIHRNLLLTTHVNLPSVAAAESSEIRLHNGFTATLVPHRFFITSSVLDLTIVGLDAMDGESNTQGQQPHYLKTCSKPNLDLGSVVYLLGYTEKKEVTIGEGKVVIATDNLIKLSTDGIIWNPGSAGFDAQVNTADEETPHCDPQGAHTQGIPTPEIYESPKLTAVPLRKKETSQIQLLDINFPPRIVKTAVALQPAKQLPLSSDENGLKELPPESPLREENQIQNRGPNADADVASTGSVNGARSEVQSSSSPVELSEMHNGYSSEGETMYSAETAESRNYTSPREGKFQQVGRSQSCVGYTRWGAVQRNPVARRALLEKQRSFIHGKKTYSQGATSQRSNDYFSPTVSSIMKKRNSEQPSKPRQSAVNAVNTVHSSPRWMF